MINPISTFLEMVGLVKFSLELLGFYLALMFNSFLPSGVSSDCKMVSEQAYEDAPTHLQHEFQVLFHIAVAGANPVFVFCRSPSLGCPPACPPPKPRLRRSRGGD
jgi:hypothetical protein